MLDRNILGLCLRIVAEPLSQRESVWKLTSCVPLGRDASTYIVDASYFYTKGRTFFLMTKGTIEIIWKG